VSRDRAGLIDRLIFGHRCADGHESREIVRTNRTAKHRECAIIFVLQTNFRRAYCGEVSVEEAEEPSGARVLLGRAFELRVR
jgi:hypothetical protein